MEFSVLKTKVEISPLFFAVLTLFLIIDKNGIANKVLLFSAMHEMGHFLALLCLKTAPRKVDFTAFGVKMELYQNMSTAQKISVFAAGFAINFIFSYIMFRSEKIAEAYINLLIGIFTAIPLESTDGGGILKLALNEVLPQSGERIFKIVSEIFIFAFSVFFMLLSVFTKNYFLVVAAVYMVFCAKKTAA